MSLVLYYAPQSSAMTCVWAIGELGVPCEKVKVDLAAKGTHTPEYLAMNPNGKVPLLVHDGTPIFESIAILAYLGETFGVEKKLFPEPGIARAQALQWLAWTNVSLAAAIHRFIQNTYEAIPAELRNAKAGELGKAESLRLLGILDKHLAGKTWMVGDTFTLVDVHVGGCMSWIEHLGFDLKAFETLHAWVGRCRARPSYAPSLT